MRMLVLNRKVMIERDEDELYDLTDSVKASIKSGLLVMPEKQETYHKKVASSGKLISWGSECLYKDEFKVGRKCWFSRFAFNRFNELPKNTIIISEDDLHCLDMDTPCEI